MMSAGLMSAWRRGGGESIPWSAFTFTRASEGSYLTAAPGSGASAFLSWASSDVLRKENRGDGAGALALFENDATNYLLYSRDPTNGAWSPSTFTLTGGAGSGPDATASACRVQGSALALDQLVTGLGGIRMCGSVWQRTYSGSAGSGQVVVYNPVTANGSASLAGTWTRFSATASGADKFRAVEAYDRSGSGGIVGSWPADVLVDLAQFETGYYPTSAIRTTSASATRELDQAILDVGDVPASFASGAWEFSQVSPIFASSDLVSGDARPLVGIGSSGDCIRIYHTGADVRAQAYVSGVVKAQSAALTFSRHALLGRVKWDPTAGVISVGGVAGATGTAWTWPTDDMIIEACDARLGTLRAA